MSVKIGQLLSYGLKLGVMSMLQYVVLSLPYSRIAQSQTNTYRVHTQSPTKLALPQWKPCHTSPWQLATVVPPMPRGARAALRRSAGPTGTPGMAGVARSDSAVGRQGKDPQQVRQAKRTTRLYQYRSENTHDNTIQGLFVCRNRL